MESVAQRTSMSRRAFATGVLSAAACGTAVAAADITRPLSLADVAEGIKPGADITATLDRALQIAEQQKIGEVSLPAGEYVVASIKLRSRVKLKGLGRGATRLKVAPGIAEPFVTLGQGPIIQASLEAMTLVGGTPSNAINPSQWAMELAARPLPGTTPANGGLWWSFIQDVQLIGFSRGVYIQGGAVPGNYQLPHQFLSVRDFVVFLAKDATGAALKIAGQAAQFGFDQCHFDHNGGIGDLTLIEIGRVGETRSATGPEPSLLRFNMCTFQNARQGIVMAESQNITFDACWFEQLQGGIQVSKNCVGTTVSNCRFANAGSAQPAVQFTDNAHGTVASNVFAGPRIKSSIRIAPTARVTSSNNIQTLGASE